MELPDDDGGVEVRAGDRRRQRGRAEAERHDAGHAPRCWPRSPPSSCPPACSTSICGDRDTGRAMVDARHPGDGQSSPARCGPAWRSPSAASQSLKRVHLELGGKAPVVVFDDADIAAAAEGDRDRRLLQRRSGLHRGDPRASPARASTTTSSPPSPSRPRAPRPACPTTRTCCSARSTTPTSSRTSAASSSGRPTTPASPPAATRSATPATSSSRPSSPTCTRTTR